MADVTITVLFVFFSVGFVSICIRHVRAHGGQARTLQGIITTNNQQETTQGMKHEAIDALPTAKYADVKTAGIECAICLSEFREGDTLRLLPECEHAFHPLCIDRWLASHATCPVCRVNILAPPPHSIAAADGVGGAHIISNDIAIRVEDERS